MTLMTEAGTNFWQRAPAYMPHMPPRPIRSPSRQSGATAVPAWKGASSQ